MKPTTPLLLLGALTLGVSAQQNQETVHAAVIFTRHGDRTPLLLQNSTLTPVGALQLYSAGSEFRNRYVSPPAGASTSSAIAALNPYQLDNLQLYAMSLVDDYVSSSAQAFLQGLYPPTNRSTLVLNQANIVANGTVVTAPLGGYQYPQLQNVGVSDPNSIWMSGNDFCPAWTNASLKYLVSSEALSNQKANADFYARIRNVIYGSNIAPNAVGYLNAYAIYDYVNYQYIHNQSTRNAISVQDLQRLRILASAQQYAQFGNLTASGLKSGDQILAIAGKTFASRVVELLESNIESSGIINKISPLFGYKNVFMSFAALAQLPAVDTNFYGLPDYAASMVFEMYSLGNNTSQFPSTRDLKIRFMFRNGTDSTDQLIAYPLFGRPRSQTEMTWSDFKAGMDKISINTMSEWCSTCGGGYYLCPLYTNNTSGDNGGGSSGKSNGMKPAVAGVIGAIIALVIIAVVTALAMLFGGLRLRKSDTKRRSDLSGFKGSEKLASDADLTSGKVADPESGKGHERVGSWEMKDGVRPSIAGVSTDAPRRPESSHRAGEHFGVGGGRHEDDELRVNPFADPVKPREAF